MRSLLLAIVAFLFLCCGLAAQGPDPIGRIDPHAMPLSQVATLAVGALDRPAIEAEDVQRRGNGQPARYAIPFAVQATTAANGSWEQLDATWSLWRLRVRAPGANHVNLGFTTCRLPGTARLMVYAADYSHIVRPFVQADVSADGQLWTPVVEGDEIVVEIYVQTAQRPQVQLTIGQVGSGYRFFGAGPTATNVVPEQSGGCQIDVVCPQSAGWGAQIAGVAAISTGGSVFCTGFMVNNTAQDMRNYFMTAYHCGITSGGAASSLVVYWNYQNAFCGVPSFNLNQFNTGSTLRAAQPLSDFTLVELNSAPNPAWGVNYLGWDYTGQQATSGTAIHHPSGDVKKISFDNDPSTTTSYGSPLIPGDWSHICVTTWDLGCTEPGSSGSPLLDQNHRVIGQLHGGLSACNNTWSDWYGRFATSWYGSSSSSTRLSDWLDPLNLNPQVIDTIGLSVASSSQFGSGCYDRAASFLEDFAPGTFDLGGTATVANSIVLTPNAPGHAVGYTVTAGGHNWFTSQTPDLMLTDDLVALPVLLPFTFVHPTGAAILVSMCSNGYVWLDPVTGIADPTPTAAELVTDPARLCPLWMDLNPALGGSTHFDVDPSNSKVYFTWLGCAVNGGSGSNDVQCVLQSSGVVEFRWRLANNTGGNAIVGYSPGNGVMQPAGVDLSTSLPLETGPDATPLTLAAANRPVLGATTNLGLGNIASGSGLGLVFLGFQKFQNGIDLGVVGMPGCRQYCSQSFTGFVLLGGPTATFPMTVPNNQALRGLHVYTQAATLTAGVNALGGLTSNGVDLRLERY